MQDVPLEESLDIDAFFCRVRIRRDVFERGEEVVLGSAPVTRALEVGREVRPQAGRLRVAVENEGLPESDDLVPRRAARGIRHDEIRPRDEAPERRVLGNAYALETAAAQPAQNPA